MRTILIGLPEAVAAVRAKRDATCNPRYREELDRWLRQVEALALDNLILRRNA